MFSSFFVILSFFYIYLNFSLWNFLIFLLHFCMFLWSLSHFDTFNFANLSGGFCRTSSGPGPHSAHIWPTSVTKAPSRQTELITSLQYSRAATRGSVWQSGGRVVSLAQDEKDRSSSGLTVIKAMHFHNSVPPFPSLMQRLLLLFWKPWVARRHNEDLKNNSVKFAPKRDTSEAPKHTTNEEHNILPPPE